MATLSLKVPDMACGACAEAITQAVLTVDGAATVKADPETKMVAVTTEAAQEQVAAAITQAGYTVEPS